MVRVRGQHVWHVAGFRRVPADRHPRAARRVRRGRRAHCDRPGGRRAAGDPARTVDRVPPQAAGHDRGGFDALRRIGHRAAGLWVRVAGFRATSGCSSHRRRGGHRVQHGERKLRQVPGTAGGSAHRERALRVDELVVRRARASDRRPADRRFRAGDDGRGGRGEFPSVRVRDSRDRRCRGEPRARGRVEGLQGGGAVRGLALHPRQRRAQAAVPQLGPGQWPDHGDGAAARRPHARAVRLPGLAVRSRLRRPQHRGTGRRTACASDRRAVRAAPSHPRDRGAAGILGDRTRCDAAWRGRARHRHGGRIRPDHGLRGVQSDLRDVPARTDAARSYGPRARGVVGEQQLVDRGHDRAVGCAGRVHRTEDGDRVRRAMPPGDAAPAALAPRRSARRKPRRPDSARRSCPRDAASSGRSAGMRRDRGARARESAGRRTAGP